VVRYLPFLISLVLTVYALFSCIQTKDEDVPNLPKLIWILLIVFVPFVGPITWLLMERSARRKRNGGGGSPARPSPRPSAPDDDPEFLRWLDRNRPDPPPSDPDPDDPDPTKR
jgi:Phospholipase_D-nuclease N-terminal